MIWLEFQPFAMVNCSAAEWPFRPELADLDVIRKAEVASIRDFVESHRDLLTGRVLDFGCGKPGTCRQPQPYRDLVAKDAEYVGVDKDDWLPGGPFDAVLCTQVLQYVEQPGTVLEELFCRLRPGGHLVLSYATNWDEVEDSDLFRFTKSGMEKLLGWIGFVVIAHERRAEVAIGNFKFPLGYGCIARKN